MKLGAWAVFVVVAVLGDKSVDVDNFAALTDDRPWVIKIHSGMCLSCKEFAPTWDAFASKLDAVDDLQVGVINIDAKPGLKLAQRLKGALSKVPKVIYMPTPATSDDYSVVDGETVAALLSSLSSLTSLPAEL